MDLLLSFEPYQIITLIISVFSLAIALISLYRTRKTLTVTWRDNIEVVNDGEVFYYDNGVPQAYGDGLYLSVEIVNPSSTDIAFFDLRAFCPRRNINTYLLTRKTLISSNNDTEIFKHTYVDNDHGIFKLDIPGKNYGVLKANSFTRLDLFVIPNSTIENEITIAFKVAIKSKFFRDPFSVTNRKIYKAYGKSFHIGGWRDMLEQNEKEEEELNER